MTPRQIAALAVRLFSVYVVLNALDLLPQAIAVIGLYGFKPSLLAGTAGFVQVQSYGVAVHFLIVSGFAVFLWFFADGMAAMMIKDSPEASTANKVSEFQVQTIAFTSIGLFFVFQAASHLVNEVSSLFTLRNFIGSESNARMKAAFSADLT